jgi:hypothetical protein
MGRSKFKFKQGGDSTPAPDITPDVFRVTFVKDFSGTFNKWTFQNKAGDVIEVNKSCYEYLKGFGAVE